MSNHICNFCNQIYYHKSNLNRHINSCKRKEIQSLKENHEKEIQSLKENHEKEIQSLKENHEKEIQSLKEQLTEFKTQIFEIAKQPKTTKTTNHNNQRIDITNQLVVYDLTQEKVIEIVNKHFSNEVFLGGPTAIVDLVRNEIVIDPDTGNPKLIMTDKSRLNGKYLTETGEVEVDLGCEKTYNILKNPLLDANDKRFSELREQHVDPKTGRIKDEERNEYDLKYGLHSKNEKMVNNKNQFVNKLFVKDNKQIK